MIRRVLAIAVATVAAVIAALVFNRPARPREPATPAASPRATVPAPASPAAVPKPAPAPAGAPAAPPRTRGRRAEPRREAPAGEAPAPAADAATATLRIDSDVPGAQVFIDREYLGTAPLTAPNVKPGTHRLNASAPGFDGVAETIDVEPGPRDVMVRFKEVRLDTAVNVVHKHRFGACRGRLLATAAGLRYDASDKADAFVTGLPDLEKFEVDYLKKNLRVELRNGRRYDFTDPEGNADRLFVFHRDVSKARERLDASAGGRD